MKMVIILYYGIYQSSMDFPFFHYNTASVFFLSFFSKGLSMFRECFALLIHPSSTRPQERWRDIAQCWQTARQISKIIISRFQQPPCLFPAPYPHLSHLLHPLSVYRHRSDVYKYVQCMDGCADLYKRSLNSMGN